MFRDLLQKTLLAVSDDKVKTLEAKGAVIPQTKPTLTEGISNVHASTTELEYIRVMHFFKSVLTKNPMDNID